MNKFRNYIDGLDKKQAQGCLLIVGIFLLLTGCGVFGWILQIQDMPKQQPVIPPDIANEILSLELGLDHDNINPNGGLIPCCTELRQIDFEYERALKSVGGRWNGMRATLTIEGIGVFEGAPEGERRFDPNASSLVGGPSEQAISPRFNVTVMIPEEFLHQQVQVRAEFGVQYPKNMTLGFVTTQEELAHNMTWFIVTPDEFKLRQDIDTWNNRQTWINTFLVGPFFLATFLLFGYISVKLIKVIRK
jgi:hypothetical protein